MLPRLSFALALALLAVAVSAPAGHAAFLPPGADFNGDGVSDLAIGAPDDSVEGADAAGAVNVLYGDEGLTTGGDQQFTQATAGVGDAPETGDRFGDALAAGDFDDDGFDDLAVAAPGEGVPTGIGPGERNRENAGMVHVLYGSPDGLTPGDAPPFTQDRPGVKGQTEPGDRFGSALAADDFDGDGRDDLGIGVPFESVGGHEHAGAVNVLYGTDDGLTPAADQLWTLNSDGVKGRAARGFRMGAALGAADMSRNDRADLAIGIPGATISGHPQAGAVLVLYGRSNGLSSVDDLWSQDSRGIKAAAERGDEFGSALEIGDFDGDNDGDLAIGVPLEDIGDRAEAGMVNVLYASTSGLTRRDATWSQGSRGIKGGPEPDDRFGSALSAVDFSANVVDDLAVGVPGEDLGDVADAGAVNVLYGNDGGGLGARADQFWSQATNGIEGDAERLDVFGWALTAGDFDADNTFDLAIGVPGDNQAGFADAGAVNVIRGSRSGLQEDPDTIWTQASSGVFGAPGDDRFGAAVQSGSR